MAPLPPKTARAGTFRDAPPNVASPGYTIAGEHIDTSEFEQTILKNDRSVGSLGLEQKEWCATIHRIRQQDRMIAAMIKIFAGLNGSVVLFVLAAWGCGLLRKREPIITEHLVMALIGSTVVQAGLAFITITKFLFPSVEQLPDKQTAEH